MTFLKRSSCVRSVCRSTRFGPSPALTYRSRQPPMSSQAMAMSGAQLSARGAEGTGRSASTTRETSHSPTPAPMKIMTPRSTLPISPPIEQVRAERQNKADSDNHEQSEKQGVASTPVEDGKANHKVGPNDERGG